MAPRKKITKSTNKAPARAATRDDTPSPETSQANPIPEFRQLSAAEVAEAMGNETDSDLSEDDPTYTTQSKPNFSFLPSNRHSSPRRANRNRSGSSDAPSRSPSAVVHRLASASTVPNSELTRTPTRRSGPQGAEPASEPQPPGRAHRRKQDRPTDWKIVREIVKLQAGVNSLIPRLSFGRVIREILSEYSDSGMRVTAEMLTCLQEAAEVYIVQMFEDAYRCTLHRGRVTLIPKDMELALLIRRDAS
uniref:Core Histone H2A/H2B/H3 domain-containing protein n=1 Tax=Anopheles albimanus TaxID=7167 RepID=A0A182F612_ANOAL